MEREEKEALEWFVAFANMNLNELKPGDRAKLIVELEEYLYPKHELEVFPPTKEGKEYSTLLTYFIRVETGMDWAFGNRPSKESSDYWSLIRHLHGVVQEALLDLAIHHPPGKKIFDATNFIPSKATSVETVAVWGWDIENKFRFFDIPLTKSQDVYVTMKVYRLFNNARRGTLQMCPAPKCNKFFLNFSLREKRFCSPLCMWRFNSAARRKKLKEEDPQKWEEYMNQQSGRMVKRYDRQRKEAGYKRITRYNSKRRNTRKEG